MGTNFYYKKQDSNHSEEHPVNHIGKRSAAGLYCWDCGTTLCNYETQYIHQGNSDWYEVCPFCGKTREEQPLDKSSTGIELGFNKEGLEHKGVGSACSFTWTIMKHKQNIEEQFIVDNRLINPEKFIIDEYNREYTAKEFLELLKDCPIQFQCCSEFS